MGKSRSGTSGPSTLTAGGGDDTTKSDRQWCEGEGTGAGRKKQQDNEVGGRTEEETGGFGERGEGKVLCPSDL